MNLSLVVNDVLKCVLISARKLFKMTDADNYNESKFMRKAKENPFVPIG